MLAGRDDTEDVRSEDNLVPRDMILRAGKMLLNLLSFLLPDDFLANDSDREHLNVYKQVLYVCL